MNRRVVLRTISYLALFVCFTLFFLLVNFPSKTLTDQVNRWISPPTDGALTAGEVHFKPPKSLAVENITLQTGQGSVDMGEALVSPHLLRLLSGKKGADVRLENPWLISDLSIDSSKEGYTLDVQSTEIDLSGLPPDIMTLPVLLDGKVRVFMDLASNDPAQGIASGHIEITSESIGIGGELLETLGFAPLQITRLLVIAAVEDNVVTLGENAMEGDITAVARGVIRLNPADMRASRLDLNVELSPGDGKRERLMPIFALLGARTRPNGSINIRIRGTIGRPSVTM